MALNGFERWQLFSCEVVFYIGISMFIGCLFAAFNIHINYNPWPCKAIDSIAIYSCVMLLQFLIGSVLSLIKEFKK